MIDRYVVALTVVLYWLKVGLDNMNGVKDIRTLWQAGIGTVSGPAGGSTIVIAQMTFKLSLAAQLLKWVFLANLPQLIFSLLYYTYNGLFTAMLMADEWNSYSTKRKGLRIVSTRPVGEQRDTYFLQLPYRWSIPLIGFSTLLHWLISQSLFLVDIDVLDFLGKLVKENPGYAGGSLRTLGYSPMAIVLVILVGFLLLFTVLAVAFGFRFRTGMPVAGSNSMAITAACHLDHREQASLTDTDVDVTTLKLQWGVTTSDEHNDADAHAAAAAVSTTSLVPSNPYETQQPQTKSHFNHEVIELTTCDNNQSLESGSINVQGGNSPDTGTGSYLSYRHCAFSARKVETPTPGQLYL